MCDDEIETDTVGLDLVARAGYDPRAGVALWRKMSLLEKSAPLQWLSSEPPVRQQPDSAGRKDAAAGDAGPCQSGQCKARRAAAVSQ